MCGLTMPTVRQALDGGEDPYPGSGFVLVATALGAGGAPRALGMQDRGCCVSGSAREAQAQPSQVSGKGEIQPFS